MQNSRFFPLTILTASKSSLPNTWIATGVMTEPFVGQAGSIMPIFIHSTFAVIVIASRVSSHGIVKLAIATRLPF